MSIGLIPFMIARLNDDEMLARAATPGPWTDAGSRRDVIVEQIATDTGTPAASLHMIAEMAICDEHEDRRTADAGHIARHDPARVLREVQAKRAIMKRHVPVVAGYGPLEDQQCCAAESSDEDMWYAKSWPCSTILAIAAVYSDHADYRDEWKP